MIDEWLKEIKAQSDPEELGMLLAYNGVVRGTSKKGETVSKMTLFFDKEKLEALVDRLRQREGIVTIRAWINQGELSIGDDIMYLLVAGRFRTDIMPVFQELLSTIKNEIVKEDEEISPA